MLLNPFQDPPDRFRVAEFSRMLGDGFPLNCLHGATVKDTAEPTRIWTLYCFYMPLKGRVLGGVRAKLIDQKNFVTFCNQRDLEILLGYAKPGSWCTWAGMVYPEIGSNDFYGFTMDSEDLIDDLHEREMAERSRYWAAGHQIIPQAFDIERRLHIDEHNDVEQVDQFQMDCDPNTGLGPDFDVHRIPLRWRRVSRKAVRWERV